MSQPSEQYGMTLMELLVALVIGSLVLTLVVRGLGLGLSVYERVSNASATMDIQFRESQWWADSIMSLVPCTDPDHCVIGSATELTGFTFAPILGNPGSRAKVTWQLTSVASGSVLIYREAQKELTFSLPLPGEAQFAYLGEDGNWRSEWNQNSDTIRLPEAIRVDSQSGAVWLYGATGQRPFGREDYRDMLDLQ